MAAIGSNPLAARDSATSAIGTLTHHEIHAIRNLAKDPSLRTPKGQDILLIRKSTGDTKITDGRFLIQGGLHGDEIGASEFVLWLADRFAKGESLLNDLSNRSVEIDFIPFANPDGTQKRTRANAQGVNLNRNFGVLWGVSRENPGQSSFSEPETRAVKYLLDTRQYTAAVDVHGYVNWIVAPSARPAVVGSVTSTTRDVHIYQQWLSAIKTQMQEHLGSYQLKTASSLGDGGAFEDYTFWQAKTPAFCLELLSRDRYERTFGGIGDSIHFVGPSKVTDRYVAYERFIFGMFKKALELNRDGGSMADVRPTALPKTLVSPTKPGH